MADKGRRIFLKIALGVGTALAVAIAAWSSTIVILENLSYKRCRSYKLPGQPKKGRTDILVVYFSRSGATELMARKIANALGADIISLKAKAYRLGYLGWFNSMLDAYLQSKAVIKPELIDMKKYELILLGSPIWLYKLTPPLWTFVKNNDFSDKRIVLFNTYNSNFSPEEIEKFKQFIENKGGVFLDHVSILRNRILSQISSKELVARTQEILDTKGKLWFSKL